MEARLQPLARPAPEAELHVRQRVNALIDDIRFRDALLELERYRRAWRDRAEELEHAAANGN